MSRVPVLGRVSSAGRVATSGRVSSQSRQGFPFTLGLRAFWRPDAGTVTLVSGKVSQVADLSGNGFHAAQTTSSRRPTWTTSWLNGAPSITFAGTQFLRVAALIQTSRDPWTMGGVFRATDISAARSIFQPGGGTTGHGLDINAAGTGAREIRANGVTNVVDGAATTSAAEVWVAAGTHATSTTTSYQLFTGTAQTSRSLSPTSSSSTAPGGTQALIGAIATTPIFPFIGDIGELWFVGRVLTSTEIAGYLAYVAQRYGAL